MPREAFERDLRRLQDEIVALGSLVGKALIESVEGLKQRDYESSRRLIAQDRTVNKQRFEIESADLDTGMRAERGHLAERLRFQVRHLLWRRIRCTAIA